MLEVTVSRNGLHVTIRPLSHGSSEDIKLSVRVEDRSCSPGFMFASTFFTIYMLDLFQTDTLYPKIGQILIKIFHYGTRAYHQPGGGTHNIFGRGCATIKSLYRPFLEFLTKKLDPFRNFCA